MMWRTAALLKASLAVGTCGCAGGCDWAVHVGSTSAIAPVLRSTALDALSSEWRRLSVAEGELDVLLTVLPVGGWLAAGDGGARASALDAGRAANAGQALDYGQAMNSRQPLDSGLELDSGQALDPGQVVAEFRGAWREQTVAGDPGEHELRRPVSVEVHPFLTQKGALAFSFLAYDYDAGRTRRLCTFDAPVTAPRGRWDGLGSRAAEQLVLALRELKLHEVNPRDSKPGERRSGAPQRDQPQLGERANTQPGPAHASRESPARATVTQPARAWQLLPADRPLRYRFAPPIEDYGGVVTRAHGGLTTLRLPEGELDIAAARFATDVASLSTGAADLDDSLHSDMFLDVAVYPEAAFELLATRDAVGSVLDAAGRRMTLAGFFRLKNRRVPLNAYVSLRVEPAAEDETELRSQPGPPGDPAEARPEGRSAPAAQPAPPAAAPQRLRLRGHFTLNIRAFELWPPEGPEPAQHMMLFELDFLLAPRVEAG